MDAIKFLKEKERMCESGKCPLTESNEYCRLECNDLAYEKLVEIVDDWSEKNPVMTNRMKLEAVFGYKNPSLTKSCIQYSDKSCNTMQSNSLPCRACPWWNEPYTSKNELKTC